MKNETSDYPPGNPPPTRDEEDWDPQSEEGPASGGKVVMFTIAIVVVLSAVFYGLNNSDMNPVNTGSSTKGFAPTITTPTDAQKLR